VDRVRVVVAYNDDADLKTHLNPVERIGEEEVVETAREVAEIAGAEILAVRDVRDAIARLRRANPDVVINLCEGVGGNPRWEMHFALVLEMLGIAFTGCDPVATGICGDKLLTKELLRAAGVSVPRGFEGEGPWIVKPSREDAGIGIDAASVCTSRRDAAARIAFVEATYRQPALVEEFLEGREFNQALFHGEGGMVLLPPGEIIFDQRLAPTSRVVGWKAKWAAGSSEDLATRNQTPSVMDDTLRSDLADLCRRAASVLSIGGYCRFDVRQRPTGELCILDVNPNPDIGRDTGFRKALAAAEIEFRDFLEQLMISARRRA
jgi:D-alanine-D-alanine ligase